MKKLILLFVFLYICISLLHAQTYWKGGTKGAENDWNTPSNWSTNHIPDWTNEAVIIRDVSTCTNDFPIITSKVTTIPYLEIHSGAELLITETGELNIDGSTTHNYGLLYYGKIMNKGKLVIVNTALNEIESPNGEIIDFNSSEKSQVSLLSNNEKN